MRVIITAIGSYGDVHPMVGLGAALRARGHDVVLFANPHFATMVERAGLTLVPLSTEEHYQQFADNPHLWHPLRGPRLVVGEAMHLLRPLYDLIMENHRPGETVLCAHGLDLASRLVQEKQGTPLASVHFAPLPIRSLEQTPRIPGMLTGALVPRWWKRFQYWLADAAILDPLLRVPMNSLRAELGLPPAKRFFDRWWYSPDLVLGLFPEWFAAPQRDWPAQTRLAGFPLWDESEQVGLSDEVASFLDEGDPPIVFTPGSAMQFGEPFFQAAVAACQRLGRRGVLLSRFAEHVPRDLPDSVRHFEFVPLSRLLPRAAAFVHHGGIGSCAQGLAAGVPQLVMPMAFDQHDNVERLRRLGVGTGLSPRKFRGPAVAAALEGLLGSDRVRVQGKAWADRCDGTAALATACEWVEGIS